MAPPGVEQQSFPLGVEERFVQNRTDIAEYLEQHHVYDCFDHLLKELIVKAPDDPLQFMIDLLKHEQAQAVGFEGVPHVVFKGPPGPQRLKWADRIATEYGLILIDPAKELQKEGIDAELCAPGDHKRVREFVQKEIEGATASRQGWVLSGFPRTHEEVVFLAQTCKVVPTRVFLMNLSEELNKNAAANHAVMHGEGDASGAILPEAMARIERQHSAYYSNLLQVVEQYRSRLRQLDFGWIMTDVNPQETDEEQASRLSAEAAVWDEIKRSMTEQPHSRGPTRSPRVVLLGPHGSMATGQAAALAEYLQAPLLDGNIFRKELQPLGGKKMDPAALEAAVFERLRQRDVAESGYVMVNYPENAEQAERLSSTLTGRWAPNRVLALEASLNTCIFRQAKKYIDPVTGISYHGAPPTEQVVRERLRRAESDQPDKVTQAYQEFTRSVGGDSLVLSNLGFDRCGTLINTEVEGTPTADCFKLVHDRICDFVIRPAARPLPPSAACGHCER